MRDNTANRQRQIMNEMLSLGKIEVKDIAQKFSISEATIRRDLRSLAKQKQIDLVYGGATLPRNNDLSLPSKEVRELEAKRVIGGIAAELINDGDQVFLDSGTTCFQLVHHLKMHQELNVVVNSLKAATELGKVSGIHVIQVGGTFRPDRCDTVGPLAVNMIDQFRGYKAFIGADGLSAEFGVSASDLESAHLYRSVIHHAHETILLADHTKFKAPSLYKITEFDSISTVVTNEKPSKEWDAFFKESKINLLYPENNTI